MPEETTNPSLAKTYVLEHYDRIAKVIQALRTGEGGNAAAEAMIQGPLGIDSSITNAEEDPGRVVDRMLAAIHSTVPEYDLRPLLAMMRLAKAMGREDLNPLDMQPFLSTVATKPHGQPSPPTISTRFSMGRDSSLHRRGPTFGSSENRKFVDPSIQLLNVAASGLFQD